MSEYLVLCLLAALGAGVNAIAGGGTLLTFPALFAALGYTAEAAVVANATSSVALFPGYIAALAGYRREFSEGKSLAALLTPPSLLGGLLGSLLLFWRPDIFKTLVPWLILLATVLFTLQPQIARFSGLGQRRSNAAGYKAAAVAFQFLVALYGGYFGAGMGILMLAALATLGMSNIHAMNAVKNLHGIMINAVAIVVFIAMGKIHWPYALPMAVAAALGSYVAAHTARRLDRRVVRAAVIAIGYLLTIYYFYRQMSPHASG